MICKFQSNFLKKLCNESLKNCFRPKNQWSITRNRCSKRTLKLEGIGEQSSRSLPSSILKPEYWLSGNPGNPPKSPEVKNEEDIFKMRQSCRLARSILQSVKNIINEGVSTEEIDAFVFSQCIKNNAYPSPLNYKRYPKSVCISVNSVACHGIPSSYILTSGDILNVDITVYKDGFHGDCSAMFTVGEVDSEAERLCKTALFALNEAINICKPGTPFSDIGSVIENIADENGFSVIPAFAGHGIGSYFHGPPDIYHVENNYEGVMKSGMTFTIEPILGEGSERILIDEDGWTAVTEDDSRTAQWEHTILITNQGHEILTYPPYV